MGVADRHRERIGGVGLKRTGHTEQHAHHVLNLGFIRSALADHGLFDLLGGVFMDTQALAYQRANRRAARLPELDCRIGIARHEYPLDRGLIGFELANQLDHAQENHLQPLREFAAAGDDALARQQLRAHAVGLDHAYAGDLRTRIHAHDDFQRTPRTEQPRGLCATCLPLARGDCAGGANPRPLGVRKRRMRSLTARHTSAMSLDHQHCYAALSARDPRFDGRFFTAVKTTGIYCRPVCPARTPKSENVRFYANAAMAEQAGFRPCLRCRPELAPRADLRLAPMDAPHALARSAALLIERDPALGITPLAQRIGVSARHLQRIFCAEFGVAPAIYARTQRLLLAKQLLTDTRLSMAQVAYAAGFSSVRRFNWVLKERYGLTPGAIRGRRSSASAGLPLTLNLAWRGHYDWAGLLNFYRQRALPGVEAIGPLAYARTLRIGASSGWIALAPARSGFELTVSSELSAVLPELIQRVRSAFDLNADSTAIEHALSNALTNLQPGLRLPGTLNPFETAVRAILGQQVSVAAATTLAARLVNQFGEPIDLRYAPAGLTRLSPTPARFASAPIEALTALGIISSRARAVVALAQAVEQGRIDWGAAPFELVQSLCALPGIGRWTAQYLLMRVHNANDACLADDLIIRREFERQAGRPLKPREVIHALAAMSPWRSYAALQIWRGARLREPTDSIAV